jgi:hypothetical protein
MVERLKWKSTREPRGQTPVLPHKKKKKKKKNKQTMSVWKERSNREQKAKPKPKGLQLKKGGNSCIKANPKALLS